MSPMKRWRTKLLVLLGGAAAIGLALPAAGQRDKGKGPESLLPPGFDQPAPPAPKETPPPPPPSAPAPPAPTTNSTVSAEMPVPPPGLAVPAETGDVAEGNATDLPEDQLVQAPPAIEIPEFARRPVEVVGPLGPDNWGLGYQAFGGANGVFLASLMRRLDAPLPSRWESMLLRRALLSEVPAPAGGNPGDWVGERAWLLLRLGGAAAARGPGPEDDRCQVTPRVFPGPVPVAP